MQSELINELAMSLVKAQAEFSAVPKGSVNPFFKSKYAGLPEVVQHTAPVLAKHGLAVSQFITHSEDGTDSLLTYLIHESGQFIAYSMQLHLAKEDMQSFGSACTYARRYSYMSCLGLVADEDDDANSATKAKASSKPKEKTSAETMRDLLSAKFSEPIERKKFVEGLMGRELKSLNDLSEAEIVGVILELS
jgi:ERF superfamily